MPVAFFFNTANGFRNLPSYTIANDPARRRDEITSFGSGCRLSGKVCMVRMIAGMMLIGWQEFFLGLSDAFQGIVRHPYLGAKQEGPMGFGKGMGRAFLGFFYHSLAGMPTTLHPPMYPSHFG